MKYELTFFSRTMRALDADGMSPALLGVILVAGLAGVWTSWLIAARVPVYQLSEVARLEMERIHPVASPVVGRVVSTSLVLGREVQKGDVLLEVEAEREKLETAEERTRLASVSSELSELERQIRAEQEALDETRRASQAALAEAAQRLAGAEVAARVAQEKVTRSNQLENLGLLSAAEAEAARGDAQGKRAEVAAARVGIERLKSEQLAAERQKRGRNRLTRSRASQSRGASRGVGVDGRRRETEAERRRIRAPVSGRLGEVNAIQIGAVVREGERLASIIPQGKVRVVAEFSAPSLGRVKPGQTGALAPRRIPLDPIRLRRRDGHERGERDARSARARGTGRATRRRLAHSARAWHAGGRRGRSRARRTTRAARAVARANALAARPPPHPPHRRRRAAISDRPVECPRAADVRAGGHSDLGDGLRSGGAHLSARRLRHSRQLPGHPGRMSNRSRRHVDQHARRNGRHARVGSRADRGAAGSRAARCRQRAAIAGCRPARPNYPLSDSVAAARRVCAADGSGERPALAATVRPRRRALHPSSSGSGAGVQSVGRFTGVSRQPGRAAEEVAR